MAGMTGMTGLTGMTGMIRVMVMTGLSVLTNHFQAFYSKNLTNQRTTKTTKVISRSVSLTGYLTLKNVTQAVCDNMLPFMF